MNTLGLYMDFRLQIYIKSLYKKTIIYKRFVSEDILTY